MLPLATLMSLLDISGSTLSVSIKADLVERSKQVLEMKQIHEEAESIDFWSRPWRQRDRRILGPSERNNRQGQKQAATFSHFRQKSSSFSPVNTREFLETNGENID